MHKNALEETPGHSCFFLALLSTLLLFIVELCGGEQYGAESL